MTTNYPFSTTLIRQRALRALCWLTLIVLPGGLIAAEQERVVVVEEETIVAEDAIAGEQTTSETTLEVRPPSSHATTQASVELILLASNEPEQFIGKTLVLAESVNAVTVGPVLEVRRRVDNQEVYLIVDATAYFNAPTRYAVAVKDVDKIAGDKVVIPEAAGMHLRGLEYYPDDYADLVNPVQPQPSVANGD